MSVVVPTYNRAHLLGEALASVAAQTRPPLETIVVDDGSTDNTAEVVARFPGAKLLHTPRVRPAAARQAALEVARGPFVAFLDSDDVWLPEKLERQLRRFRQRPEAALVYTDSVAWDGRQVVGEGTHADWGPPAEGWIYPHLLMRNVITCSSVVARAECLRAVGGFTVDPRQRMALDWPVWLRLARRYPVAYVPEVLVYYRVHPDQRLRSAEAFEQSVGLVLAAIFGDPTQPAEVRRLRRRRMGRFRADLAELYSVEGRRGRAVANALRALWWWPWDPGPALVGAKAVVKAVLGVKGDACELRAAF